MKANQYISDKPKLVKALFEEAFNASIEDLVSKWESYTNLALTPENEGKLQFAYTLAQEYKSDLDYYPYLAFQVACHHDYPWGRFERSVCEDLLLYCHNEKLRFEAEYAVKSIDKRLSDECGVGFTEEAKPFVENLDLMYDAMGKDVTLHDAIVSKVDYDRDNGTATVVIDTLYHWKNHRPSLITIRFDEILSIKLDSDLCSDYVDEFVCFYQDLQGGTIWFVLKSADFRVECKHMTIISVEEHDC